MQKYDCMENEMVSFASGEMFYFLCILFILLHLHKNPISESCFFCSSLNLIRLIVCEFEEAKEHQKAWRRPISHSFDTRVSFSHEKDKVPEFFCFFFWKSCQKDLIPRTIQVVLQAPQTHISVTFLKPLYVTHHVQLASWKTLTSLHVLASVAWGNGKSLEPRQDQHCEI